MSANVVLRHGLKGDVRLDKEKAPEKIDGFSALCNAMMVWLTQPVAPVGRRRSGVVARMSGFWAVLRWLAWWRPPCLLDAVIVNRDR